MKIILCLIIITGISTLVLTLKDNDSDVKTIISHINCPGDCGVDCPHYKTLIEWEEKTRIDLVKAKERHIAYVYGFYDDKNIECNLYDGTISNYRCYRGINYANVKHRDLPDCYDDDGLLNDTVVIQGEK